MFQPVNFREELGIYVFHLTLVVVGIVFFSRFRFYLIDLIQ